MTISYDLPDSVKSLLRHLRDAGFEAYVVGGAVRDILMGLVPSDYDVTTSATPDEVIRVFGESTCHKTGIAHGTVTVVWEGEPMEVTTFRVDGAYQDGRHPDSVAFTRSLEEDVVRRDFTMNALALGEDGVILDYCGGIEDLKQGLVRAIGDPKKRFEEDALRILRAIRFAAQHGFSIETQTAQEIIRQKEALSLLSVERIWQELAKFFTGKASCVGGLMREYREVFAVIMPEIRPMWGFEQHNPHHVYDVWEHTLVAMESTEPELILRFTMLLHDIGKPSCFTMDDAGVGHFYGHQKVSADIAEEICKRLKVDNTTREEVVLLVRNHDMSLIPTKKIVRRRLAQFGEPVLRTLIQVKKADMRGHSKLSAYRFDELDQFTEILDTVIEEKLCCSLEALAVNGKDLMAIGIPQGTEIGRIKQALLDEVIEEMIPNEKDKLLERAQVLYTSHI